MQFSSYTFHSDFHICPTLYLCLLNVIPHCLFHYKPPPPPYYYTSLFPRSFLLFCPPPSPPISVFLTLVNLYMFSLLNSTLSQFSLCTGSTKRWSLWLLDLLKLLVDVAWVVCALLWWGGTALLFLPSLCLSGSVLRLLALRPDIKLAQLSPL